MQFRSNPVHYNAIQCQKYVHAATLCYFKPTKQFPELPNQSLHYEMTRMSRQLILVSFAETNIVSRNEELHQLNVIFRIFMQRVCAVDLKLKQCLDSFSQSVMFSQNDMPYTNVIHSLISLLPKVKYTMTGNSIMNSFSSARSNIQYTGTLDRD